MLPYLGHSFQTMHYLALLNYNDLAYATMNRKIFQILLLRMHNYNFKALNENRKLVYYLIPYCDLSSVLNQSKILYIVSGEIMYKRAFFNCEQEEQSTGIYGRYALYLCVGLAFLSNYRDELNGDSSCTCTTRHNQVSYARKCLTFRNSASISFTVWRKWHTICFVTT